MTVTTIDDLYRDYDVDNQPASGVHHPSKQDIRDTLKKLLEGISTFPDNRVIRLNNANTGTANNIVVSASVAIPAAAYQVLYILNVTRDNTGPVTVSGAINRELVTNTSRPIPAGYLTPGMAVLCIDTGTTLRMLSYGDMEVLIRAAQAEVERARLERLGAEAARDIAAGYASDAVSQGNVPIYSTAVGLAALKIPEGINFIRTNGFYSAGDGGGAGYRLKDTIEADEPGDRVSSGGAVRWGLSERFPNILQFGVRTDVATDANTALIQEGYNYAKGRSFYIPEGRYYITYTIIKPDGVMDYGSGKYDYWTDNRNVGSIFITSGAGNPTRWTDIDGADPSDDTPMFVLGGNGVHSHGITLITEGATPWSSGWFAPCVKQGGLHDCQAFGFIDGCAYLDATWSDRNTTLKNLHPTVNPSTGMNEFTIEGCWFIASNLGGFAIKIQGTTRSGTSVATANDWLWGAGGTSDIRISNCRLSGRHASGGEFSHDAQLFGVNAYGQGVSIINCAFRGSNSGFAAKLDRSNRIIFTACYGEEVGSGVHAFSVTSRTKLSVDGITLRQDKLNVPMYVDGVQVASSLSQ